MNAFQWVTSAEFDHDNPFTPADEASMNKLHLGAT